MIIDAEFEEITKPFVIRKLEAKVAKLDLVLVFTAFAIGYMAF